MSKIIAHCMKSGWKVVPSHSEPISTGLPVNVTVVIGYRPVITYYGYHSGSHLSPTTGKCRLQLEVSVGCEMTNEPSLTFNRRFYFCSLLLQFIDNCSETIRGITEFSKVHLFHGNSSLVVKHLQSRLPYTLSCMSDRYTPQICSYAARSMIHPFINHGILR